jgi:hypothetical protein
MMMVGYILLIVVFKLKLEASILYDFVNVFYKNKIGDVEAIVVLKDDDNKQKKYKLLTRLHTLNAYPKDRERIEKNR